MHSQLTKHNGEV